MSFREVSVVEIKEILRLWLAGTGLREVARLSGTDRKTVRRYVEMAQSRGLDRDGGAAQLTDDLLAAVVGGVRSKRPNGKSQAWELIAAHHDQVEAWLKQGLTLTKVNILLGRRGVVVSYRTLNRYAAAELDFGRRRSTLPVIDGDPGSELQIDFGRLGMIEIDHGRRRVVKGLIFTAVYSRHMLVWPTFTEALPEVIAGCEAAWEFFDGVFAVIIPDNMKSIVDQAHPTDPRLNDSFREYAESRGFVVDPARVRSPQDKPRVERCVQYVRHNFFAGVQVPLSAALGIFSAGRQRYRAVLSWIYVLPLLISPTGIAISWAKLLDPTFGGLAPFVTQAWLSNAFLAPIIVTLIFTWRIVPFYTILIQAAVRAVPTELLESAGLDGASRWKQIRFVILPQIRHTLVVVSILCLTGALTAFDLFFVMTGGGPNGATTALSVGVYLRAFNDQSLGAASAYAVVVTLIGLVFAGVVSRRSGFGTMNSER